MVAQACNPSYLGGGDWEDPNWWPGWAKNYETTSQPLAGCGGMHLSFQLHWEAQMGESWSRHETRPYLKNNQHQRAEGVVQMVEHCPTKCKP
jgi:hypothetical protein